MIDYRLMLVVEETWKLNLVVYRLFTALTRFSATARQTHTFRCRTYPKASHTKTHHIQRVNDCGHATGRHLYSLGPTGIDWDLLGRSGTHRDPLWPTGTYWETYSVGALFSHLDQQRHCRHFKTLPENTHVRALSKGWNPDCFSSQTKGVKWEPSRKKNIRGCWLLPARTDFRLKELKWQIPFLASWGWS